MIVVILILLGLCFGSFINAATWRIQQQSMPRKKRPLNDKALSISQGRSVCSRCLHPLAVADLVPVFSWLWLRGKCRYCHKPIQDNPLIELLLPVLFVVSYVAWPHGFDVVGWLYFGYWLVALTALVGLALYDLRWMLLPNRIVYPLIALGAVHAVIHATLLHDLNVLIMAALAAAVAGGIFHVLFYASQGKWIGGGDVKLGYALGLLVLTPQAALLVLFGASLLGTLVAYPLLATKRIARTARIPFGPFLIAAAAIVVLFGQRLIDAYMSTIV